MKIKIICVGKLPLIYQDIFKFFLKKISFFSKINIHEIKEIKEKNIELKKTKETKAILNFIPENTNYIFLCTKNGKKYSSLEFSNFFNEDKLCFVIGGSHGVQENMFKNKISFSKMTFPHQLFRLILIEQIFRALSIKKGMKYHK